MGQARKYFCEEKSLTVTDKRKEYHTDRSEYPLYITPRLTEEDLSWMQMRILISDETTQQIDITINLIIINIYQSDNTEDRYLCDCCCSYSFLLLENNIQNSSDFVASSHDHIV